MRVLLVHGMGRSPLSTWGLARYLQKHGHTTELFGYSVAFESFHRIRTRLRARLERMAARGPYAAVGHSLGGLLLRDALQGLTPPPAHLVMLGTPNHPSRLAGRARAFWPYRMATRESGQRLSQPEYYATLQPLAVPYTIIAGTAGPRGKHSPFGDELNDSVVAVSETRIVDRDEPTLFPVHHTFIMHDKAVRAAVARALE